MAIEETLAGCAVPVRRRAWGQEAGLAMWAMLHEDDGDAVWQPCGYVGQRGAFRLAWSGSKGGSQPRRGVDSVGSARVGVTMFRFGILGPVELSDGERQVRLA